MDGTRARAMLGLPAHPTTEEVRRAFRRAIATAHPDHGGDPARFRAVLEARDVLLAQADARPSPPPGIADAYGARLAAPPRHTLHLMDVTRSPRRYRREVPPPDFDDVLATVLPADEGARSQTSGT